jgi:hypothetical protein
MGKYEANEELLLERLTPSWHWKGISKRLSLLSRNNENSGRHSI